METCCTNICSREGYMAVVNMQNMSGNRNNLAIAFLGHMFYTNTKRRRSF